MPNNWIFITSPPGWWAVYKQKGKEEFLLPIVAWRMLADNRHETDISQRPDDTTPYGEPIIHEGDGLLASAFRQGNYKEGEPIHGQRHDMCNADFLYAEYIPKTKGTLEQNEDGTWGYA